MDDITSDPGDLKVTDKLHALLDVMMTDPWAPWTATEIADATADAGSKMTIGALLGRLCAYGWAEPFPGPPRHRPFILTDYGREQSARLGGQRSPAAEADVQVPPTDSMSLDQLRAAVAAGTVHPAVLDAVNRRIANRDEPDPTSLG